MTQKNKAKAERKAQRGNQTFVGCRPARFKDKTKYSRKGRQKGVDKSGDLQYNIDTTKEKKRGNQNA